MLLPGFLRMLLLPVALLRLLRASLLLIGLFVALQLLCRRFLLWKLLLRRGGGLATLRGILGLLDRHIAGLFCVFVSGRLHTLLLLPLSLCRQFLS